MIILKDESIKPGDSQSGKQHETAAVCKCTAGKGCGCCVQYDTSKAVKNLGYQDTLIDWGYCTD